MIYRTCPYCGAHLDPGERCDCDLIPQPELEESGHTIRKRRPRGEDAPRGMREGEP